MKKALLLLFVVGTLHVVQAADGVASATLSPSKPGIVRLSNPLVDVEIDLTRGARISSFCYAGFNREDVIFDYAADGGNGGMIKDLWTTQGWPGEFDKRLYEAEILNPGPDQAVVQTKTLVTGTSNNKSNPILKDLVLYKTFTLKKESRMLSVKIEIKNPTATGRRVAYWSQSALDFDSEGKSNRFFRPVRHGVDVIGKTKESDYNYMYSAVPRAGWNGVANPNKERGVVFLMDYNSLEKLYDNSEARTAEWMYDAVAIPAGQSWTTRIDVLPTEGFAGYRHADGNVVGDFAIKEVPAGLLVEHTLAAASGPLANVQVETSLNGAKGDWTQAGTVLSADQIGFKPFKKEVLIPLAGALPCIVRTTVSWDAAKGERNSVTYEDFYGGKKGRNINPELLEPIYVFEAPPKRPKYLKPDAIKLVRGEKPRILFVRGLWADFQGVEEALASLGDVEVVNAWMKKTALGETVSNFPGSYEELVAYDMIILGNVSGRMLGNLGQEMLADFAAAGGGILMLSGDRTYGQGGFTNERFLEMLPVSFPKKGDYRKLKAPSSLFADPKQPLAADLKLDSRTQVLYAHHLTPKPTSETVLTLAGGEPAVVVAGAGQPKIAAIGVLPFGEPATDLYYQHPEWHAFMARLIRSLQPSRPETK
ncbi:MAG: hypothetical protein ACOYM3_11910 [Terrimicrobiaceae bacterium]